MTWDHEADAKVRLSLTRSINTNADRNSFSSESSPPVTSSSTTKTLPNIWDPVSTHINQITTSTIKKQNLLTQMNTDCTIFAIQRRLQRLRTDPRAGSATNGDSSTPPTPEKRKRGCAKKDANGDGAEKDKASPKKAKKAKK